MALEVTKMGKKNQKLMSKFLYLFHPTLKLKITSKHF